ncbi:TetR/AcrR family transcriptional regulator [Virgibacillus ndiopensis]|uniref:TetR/AcrR family transcriptional regulator n=1 Tax=Virgibacillus ndiopensis TaxID=2004408 RepID=UPI000C08A7A2|nr:TetR/AcrR family transcriptional regulator [Virgibacillus ndiopensis]
MPRGFTEQEKEKIKEKLMVEAKYLFSQFGLKKTSIQELTKSVGIAPGSFYTFFNSKEELYFEIIEQEEESIKREFMNFDITSAQDPKQAIKNLLLHALTMIEENVLINQLLFDNNYDILLRKLPKEKLEAHLENDSDTLAQITSKWKDLGILRKVDEDVLAGLFRALFTMSLHKNEIGENVYPQTLELLVDLIVDGLFRKEK